MPTQTSERWIADGNAVKSQLEDEGYKVDLQYAGDDIPTQSQQVDQMITQGADLLIIAAIDGTALSSQLQAAADADIPVISYDRLIRDTENVDFYVSFDNYKVGVAQATALLTGLGVTKADGSAGDAKGPFNIELFAGSLDDNNAHFFFSGAMDTLKKYIDDGTLVVKSGQTDIEQAAILRWQQETAQKRMEDLLTSSYNDGSKVDGVLSPYDGLSRGIITALQNAGYGAADKPMPVVTGQDAEIASVKLIADGVQNSTIFKDTRLLAEQAVIAAKAFLAGDKPEANDTKTYDNGVKVVPSYLLPVETVYKDDIQKKLVDTGYWTAAEVASGQSD
jgi:putative multiple sugar transport system substrate-binding protein